MDKSSDEHKFLSAGKITAPTIAMLKNEGISSIAAFRTLQMTDIDQLSNRNKHIPYIQIVYLRELLEKLTYNAESKPAAKKEEPRKLHGKTKTRPRQYVTLHFGGMVYDSMRKIGIRKKTIPSPRLLKFTSRASYKEVMGTVIPVFFPNGVDNISHYSLADSSGVPLKIDKEKWTLEIFLKECKTPPSKIRLYVMYKQPQESDGSETEYHQERALDDMTPAEKMSGTDQASAHGENCSYDCDFLPEIPWNDTSMFPPQESALADIFNDDNTDMLPARKMAKMSSTEPIPAYHGQSSSYDFLQDYSLDDAGHLWSQYGNPKWD